MFFCEGRIRIVICSISIIILLFLVVLFNPAMAHQNTKQEEYKKQSKVQVNTVVVGSNFKGFPKIKADIWHFNLT